MWWKRLDEHEKLLPHLLNVMIVFVCHNCKYNHRVSSVRHFVSFGTGRKGWSAALCRLRKEIVRLDPQAQVWLFDESNAGDDIDGLDVGLSEFARLHPRGYGYWVWKPWVLLQVMKQAQPGDIVFYLDAGCTVHTSPASKLRYEWYLGRIRTQGRLLFQQKYKELNWTKRDVTEHFQLRKDDLESGQLLGGVQGHLVAQSSIEFVEAWLRACTMDSGRLLLDVSSKANEDERFIEHRHDQSILSCLSKTRKIELLPDETFFHPHWNRDGDGYPFWATRKRSGLPAWMGYYAPMAVVEGRLRKFVRRSAVS